MKILHLHSGSLDSGAGRGVVALHEALISEGITSVIYTQNVFENSRKQNYLNKAAKIFTKCKNHLITTLVKRRSDNEHIITITSNNSINLKQSDFNDVDIIHLHWVVDMQLLQWLVSVKKPIVWTLRDCFPFTAVCHYPMSCRELESGCNNCPAVNSYSQAIPRTQFLKKSKFHSEANVTWIGISDYISKLASSSQMSDGRKVITIHNHTNITISNQSYKTARELFGVPESFLHVVYGCQNLTDPYKGVSNFIDSMLKLIEVGIQVKVSIYGANSNKIKKRYGGKLGSAFVFYGHIKNDEYLADLYKSSDIFLGASVQDAFSKTLLEAACNGAYIITSKNVGAVELLNGYENKTIVKHPTSQEFFTACLEYYTNFKESRIIRKPFDYDSSLSTESYINLYQDLICKL